MDYLGNWIAESKNTTPTVFDFSFDPRPHFFRAVDWQHFLLHVVPTSVIPYLRHASTKNALMDLCNACAISLQWTISPHELARMGR